MSDSAPTDHVPDWAKLIIAELRGLRARLEILEGMVGPRFLRDISADAIKTLEKERLQP